MKAKEFDELHNRKDVIHIQRGGFEGRKNGPPRKRSEMKSAGQLEWDSGYDKGYKDAEAKYEKAIADLDAAAGKAFEILYTAVERAKELCK